jgi:hypothetical protein
MRALVLTLLLALAGCTYYVAPGGPASFDRSWDAARGALYDQGVQVTSEDRGAGVVRGRLRDTEVSARVRTLADGAVQVEFNSPGSRPQDRELVERISRAYDARMGR